MIYVRFMSFLSTTSFFGRFSIFHLFISHTLSNTFNMSNPTERSNFLSIQSIKRKQTQGDDINIDTSNQTKKLKPTHSSSSSMITSSVPPISNKKKFTTRTLKKTSVISSSSSFSSKPSLIQESVSGSSSSSEGSRSRFQATYSSPPERYSLNQADFFLVIEWIQI